MTSSQTDIIINDLALSVYGLAEYKRLAENTPVAVMFGLHGRLQNKSKMETIAQVLCSLNGVQGRRPNQRHLLVVTFDHANHGSRLVNKKANYSWKEGKHENPTHAMDMWSMVCSGARTVTELIDVLENHLFGSTCRPVQSWGCIGFSMGGHSTFLAAANDPRISVQIAVVGTSDYIDLMRARLAEGNFPEHYLPKDFCDTVQAHYDGLAKKLGLKKVLMISGREDRLVPSRYNDALVHAFKANHSQTEFHDWARIAVPNVGHTWCPEMFELAAAWCFQWMVSCPEALDTSFTLSLPSSCRL